MVLQPYESPLRENGPIVRFPNWQSLSSSIPNPKGDGLEAPAPPNPQSEIRGSTELAEVNPQSAPPPNPQSQAPARPGRPRALDRDKQATICNLVAAGVSLRQAAQFVDCDRSSIRREAKRNGEFRRQFAKARSEASIHPLETLRRAARADWRAALCWMERLDPQRFARPDASVVTQRESNQFVVNLVESIEHAVSNPRERVQLFELLSAVMPAAMRRRWQGRRVRGKLQETKMAEERRCSLERMQRDDRRFEFFREIARYLPNELHHKLHQNLDLLDPEEVFRPPARGTGAPAQVQCDAMTHDSSTRSDATNADSTSAGPTSDGRTGADFPNIAPPADSFAPHPERNPDNNAPPPHANYESANDLRQPGGAKLPE
jgi:hypothetical protein